MPMELGLHCLQWLSGKVMLQLSCEGMLYTVVLRGNATVVLRGNATVVL